MKFIRYIFLGIIFGITLTKAEIVSWFRIYEMFRFQSFHMYGVIGSAVVLGIIIQLIKWNELKTIEGEQILLQPKHKSVLRYLIGGTIFGLGWALTGACPGPSVYSFGKRGVCYYRSDTIGNAGNLCVR